MKRHLSALCATAGLSLALSLGLTATASAQNVVITNARIIDGTGKVIERGSLVARDGRIVSVGTGAAPSEKGAARIDARGMTIMPAFIDAHRHLIRGPAAPWLADQAGPAMKAFVDAGFTTVFSMGDDPQGILELRRRLKQETCFHLACAGNLAGNFTVGLGGLRHYRSAPARK